MYLIGDIGGTKTALAVVARESGPRHLRAEMTFPSARFPSFNAIIEEFLRHHTCAIEKAVFGVAGPVVKGCARLTNLPWHLDEQTLEEAFGFDSAMLLNDLEAVAYGVPSLEPEELFTLNEGDRGADGTIAVVAPGTGLGEAFLIRGGSRYRAHSSEGGHGDFAPRSEREIELFSYLQRLFGHVSYERVCSGQGIANIYAFLKDGGYGVEPLWLGERLRAADDKTPLIVNAALDRHMPCQLCMKSLEQFVAILGAEAANMVLKVMATGGVYLGGGIPARILPVFEKNIFMESFCDKGRYAEFMQKIPVHIILNTDVALLGAACRALED